MARKILFEDEPANVIAVHTHAGNIVVGGGITHTAGNIGLYGTTPVAQRTTTSVQRTSNLASSTAFGPTQLAALQEVMNTLAAYGLWSIS